MLLDGGKQFNCETVQKVLQEYGTTHRLAMPYTPEQNGASAQENRTIVESSCSVLHANLLPEELWAEACNPPVYIHSFIHLLCVHKIHTRLSSHRI